MILKETINILYFRTKDNVSITNRKAESMSEQHESLDDSKIKKCKIVGEYEN
jgi:hypothetical protein